MVDWKVTRRVPRSGQFVSERVTHSFREAADLKLRALSVRRFAARPPARVRAIGTTRGFDRRSGTALCRNAVELADDLREKRNFPAHEVRAIVQELSRR